MALLGVWRVTAHAAEDVQTGNARHGRHRFFTLTEKSRHEEEHDGSNATDSYYCWQSSAST